jgi:hypothetical protein
MDLTDKVEGEHYLPVRRSPVVSGYESGRISREGDYEPKPENSEFEGMPREDDNPRVLRDMSDEDDHIVLRSAFPIKRGRRNHANKIE